MRRGESDQHSAAESDDWLEDREHYNEGQNSRTQAWPLGLIAVAVVALMLLVAGGYGVMQERAAIEERAWGIARNSDNGSKLGEMRASAKERFKLCNNHTTNSLEKQNY